MTMTTILAVSSYFKGEEFLRECKRQGAHVILLTEENLKDDPWPNESIDERFLMPNLSIVSDLVNGVAYLARSRQIDRIIALDEYDVENVAILREHLRIPGMGITLTKRFRDKLIMREAADKAGVRVPQFTKVVNYDVLRDFMRRVPPPWVLKPRLEAGAMGIRRVYNEEELWRLLDQLGDEQSFRVLEQYVPGSVYHVDAIIYQGETVFASVQRYGAPPLNVSHDGGIFTTLTVPPDSEDAVKLRALNIEVIRGLGLEDGATHAEFIKGNADGEFYFLEIAARVGGANISDLVHATTGANPWAEWAKVEIALARGEKYVPPVVQQRYGGLLVSLARQEYPDLSGYNDPEIVWRMNKKQHVGLIVACDDLARTQALVDSYKERFVTDFLAVAPAKDKPDAH